MPDIDKLQELAACLGVSVNELLSVNKNITGSFNVKVEAPCCFIYFVHKLFTIFLLTKIN